MVDYMFRQSNVLLTDGLLVLLMMYSKIVINDISIPADAHE